MNVKDLESAGEQANDAVGRIGITKTAVMLAEGFCPICLTRSSTDSVLDSYDADPERPATAVVNCATCLVMWRTGPNPDNPTVPEWIEHTRQWNNMYLTMCLNPPNDPPEEEDWWDEEE